MMKDGKKNLDVELLSAEEMTPAEIDDLAALIARLIMNLGNQPEEESQKNTAADPGSGTQKGRA